MSDTARKRKNNTKINASHNLCPHVKLMKEQKTFTDIPEPEGIYELPDQFKEDEMFDGRSEKNLPEKVI